MLCVCAFCGLFSVNVAFAAEVAEGADAQQQPVAVASVEDEAVIQQDADEPAVSPQATVESEERVEAEDDDADAISKSDDEASQGDGDSSKAQPKDEKSEAPASDASKEEEAAPASDASNEKSEAPASSTANEQPKASEKEDKASQDQADAKEPAAADKADADAKAPEAKADEAPAKPEPLLAEGDYVIKSGLGGKFVLDVADGSTANGANVQIYEYNATDGQRWHVSCDADGYYLFKNLKSGKLLEFAGTAAANGANVRQNAESDTLTQKWVLVKSGDGFKIASAKDQNFVLDIAYAKAANGTNAQLYKSKDSAAQKFVFALVANSAANASVTYDTPIAPGDYLIQSALGTFVLDVAWGSSDNGANVQLYQYNGTKGQKWHVEYDEQGLYTITNVGSGKPLDLSWAKAWYGQNVQQFRAKDTAAQKWIITAQGTKYTIASAVDSLFVLDVAYGRAENGANVQVYYNKGTAAQRFGFMSLSPSLPTSDEVADGVYVIAAGSDNGFVLDVADGSLVNGANVQLYKNNDTSGQRWGVVRNSDGLYSVFNMASGKMLDVTWGSPLAGANIQQYAGNDSKAAQKWAIVKNASDSTYTLVSAVSGTVLDIAGAKVANGSNIQVYTANGNANQKFSLLSKPLLEAGVYALHPTRNTDLAADVPWGTAKDGTALQVFTSKDSPAQHVVVKASDDGSFALQFVGTGKYIADASGKAVQRAFSTDASQRWTVTLAKGGLVFTNAATGKALGVADSSPKKGTALVTTDPGILNTRFGLRKTSMLVDGLYTFGSAVGGGTRVLDVVDGAWKSGTNAQLFAANGGNAQKFLVRKVNGDYYKVLMALSGLALNVSGGSKGDGANVDFSTWNGGDAQLWKAVITDNGLSFVNKASGLALDVAGGADKNGANIDQKASTGSTAQAWNLSPTKINIGDLGSIQQLVRSVAGGSGIKASYSVPQALWNNLVSAVSACWNNGRDIGFLMTDLQTGNYVSLNADKIFYSACTMKACYVTWLFQEVLETGRTSWEHVADRLYPAIIESENSTYLSLRAEFGSAGVNNWLHAVGLNGWGEDAYTFYTPRELQLIWTRILAYEQSGGKYVGNWRSLFGSNNYSPIADELRGDHAAVYAKPGWYPLGSEYGTLSDGSIVQCKDGRRYLLTVMSSVDPYGEYDLHRRVDRALDAIFQAAPGL